MPSPHSLYELRVILIVSAYFYMDMYCFWLVREVSGWLRVVSVAAEIVLGGWLQMVSGGFGWFRVVCCFSSYSLQLLILESWNFVFTIHSRFSSRKCCFLMISRIPMIPCFWFLAALALKCSVLQGSTLGPLVFLI